MLARGLAGVAPLLLVLIGCTPPPRPQPAPVVAILPVTPPVPEPTVTPPPPEPLPPPPPPPPRRNAADLRAEFGAPDFVRREVDSELWRYDGQGCALFALLYRDNEDYLVRHLETLPAGNGMPLDENCVNSVKLSAAPSS